LCLLLLLQQLPPPLLHMILHLRQRLRLRLTNLSSAAVGWCFKL
jgi:hypothetical protein